MFNELSDEQIAAARSALARPIEDAPSSSHKRVFNLDAAKLLYVHPIMYDLQADIHPDCNVRRSCTSGPRGPRTTRWPSLPPRALAVRGAA